jgi:hypothetical protein
MFANSAILFAICPIGRMFLKINPECKVSLNLLGMGRIMGLQDINAT